MNDYFGASINVPPFQEFSASHIAALAILTILTIGLFLWFSKCKSERSVDCYFRYFFAVFLLINEILPIFWCMSAGLFTLDYALPLQLCDIVAFLSFAMLIGGNKTTFELVYFLGLGGSLQALITPDLYYPFPHFMFFNFFIGHGCIIIAVFYMIAAKGYRPTLNSIKKVFLYTNLYAGFVAIVNAATGGNYLFLCAKPEDPSLIDFLGPWPWYILSLEGILLVTCLLLYFPYAIKKPEEESRKNS